MSPPPSPRAAPLFSGLTVLWMILVGCVSALLFTVLSAYAPELRSLTDGGVHAGSKSAIGFAGLVRLLTEEGAPVVLSRDAHPGREPAASLRILTPNLGEDPKRIAALENASVVLIVLPKWVAAPDPSHPGWVIKEGLAPEAMISRQLLNAFDAGDHLERAPGKVGLVLKGAPGFLNEAVIPSAEIDSPQTIAGPDPGWVAAVETDPQHAVLIKRRDRDIFILSDPNLLNNQGLASLPAARGASAIISVLRGGDGVGSASGLPVVFDLTLAGFTRTRSLLALAFAPPFLAATLCAIAAAGLMGVHAAARFGPPARSGAAFAFGKRALADNSAALIRLVGREHRMGGGYAAVTRAIVAQAVGAPRDLDDNQMDALLDRLGRTRGASALFSDLERRARDASDAPALMAAARALYAWRLEMTHERR